MSAAYDVAIVGAGPAGMAAAATAVECGLSAVVLDEQAVAGGQIYRNVGRASAAVRRWLGKDYEHGAALVGRLETSGVTHLAGASVWDVSPELQISYLVGAQGGVLKARHLIVATGAIERPSPLPGWTLPGVMNAGAAQILMKSSASVPSGRVVLVGCGPLLYLVAVQLLDAGADVHALVETAPASSLGASLRYFPAALRSPGYLVKGMRMLARLRAAGVRRERASGQVRILGEQRVTAVEFESSGTRRQIAADVALLHHGVIPNVQLTRMLRLDHHWNAMQNAWWPRTDEFGRSSVESISLAGDGGGIAGALAAEASGRIAALDAARRLGALDQARFAQLASQAQGARRAQLHIRPFLDVLYRPPQWLFTPPDETMVCRCEEVSAGEIRQMARLGCRGPNQTKFFSRCGMGPCQGRMCGPTVSHLLAEVQGVSVEEVGYYRIRAPLKPIPLSALAGMNELETETEES